MHKSTTCDVATPVAANASTGATRDGLATVKEYEGTISAAVDGTPYAGNFKEEAHGSHGHSHGEDDK